jgi:hypothetical protein
MTDEYTDFFPDQYDDFPVHLTPVIATESPNEFTTEPLWFAPVECKETPCLKQSQEVESFDTTETSQRKSSFDDEDDLNKKVDLIIANSRTFKKRKHADKKADEPVGRSKKPKIRKTNDQVEVLKQHYKPNWSKQEIATLAKITGLTELQVYKWSWDQSNKKAN